MASIKGRLTELRAITREDLVLLHGWLNDPDIMQYWDGRDHPATFDRVEARFRRSVEGLDRDAVRFMIDIRDGDAVKTIGMIQHARIVPRARHTQVDLLIGDPAYRDTGYGSDAMRAFLGYLFRDQKLRRAWCTLRAPNARAVRGVEKCGFVREGVLRQHDFLEGKLVDVVVYGMLASELREDDE